MAHPEEPTLPEDTGQRKNKNMEELMKMIVRRTALAVCTVVLAVILPTAASAACTGFDDLPETADCYESVMYLAEHEITQGTGNGYFSPDAPVTVRQWAMMLCRAYDVKVEGNSWSDLSQSAVEQSYRKGWLNETALSAPNIQLCRGALLKSAFAAAKIPVYDSVLYAGGVSLPDHENCIRIGKELQLCGEANTANEIVTRRDAAMLLHAILTRAFTVEAPPAPVALVNAAGVNINDYLVALRQVPEPMLAAFNAAGWTYRIDFDYISELSKQLNMSCIGATNYSQKTLYISEASATLHEFGHFLDWTRGFPAEYEQLYLAEAQNSGLRDYAKTNAREYFADCFAYCIIHGNDSEMMESLRKNAPQTCTYFEELGKGSRSRSIRSK
jgi:hypothetical protein